MLTWTPEGFAGLAMHGRVLYLMTNILYVSIVEVMSVHLTRAAMNVPLGRMTLCIDM